ncbi:hypothetical protein [Micromonospora lupini]|uniref:Uncharacterized protein n=1 Tax=Micromonospora lupini str. Lupac 08 TaxID=1150864 RepID=I0LA11_9ACTN|nr:hypothetical protein [Micromonospora lupini]CCH20658.1 exported hypothetical protein [Micromonospora lupini str. Lupac 08]
MTTAVPKSSVKRRGVLRGIGAGGLAAAVAVFAKGSPAQAANWNCCTLDYVPPNISMTTCLNASHYVWTCTFGTVGPIYRCQCCERKRADGSYNASAGKCTCTSNC